MFLKILSAMILLNGFTLPIFAQQKVSLIDAVKMGLEKNFQIRIAQRNIEIAENNNSWGLAGRYPTITMGISQGNTYNNSESAYDPGIRSESWIHTVKPNININWVLFNGFSIEVSKEKYELLEKLSRGDSAIIVENTIQAIILAYYRVLLEQEKLNTLNEVTSLSKDRYDYILVKKDLGASVTYDVLQAKTAYLNDKANQIAQEINVKSAQRNLNLLLGEAAETEYILTDIFTSQQESFDFETLLKKMLSSNKTLQNQYINQELLQNDIALSKSGRYPSLSVNLGGDYNLTGTRFPDTDLIDTHSYDFYLNFSLSYSLYSGGNIEREITNAKISEAIGKLKIEEIKLSLTNQLRTVHELYNLRSEILKVTEESIESAKLNLQISGEKFRSGAISSFNYRDVQLVYLNTAFSRLQAIYNLISTHTDLLRLTGGIITEY